VYTHTQDSKYLITARRLAEYFLNNLPKDGVVPWYIIIATLPDADIYFDQGL